MNTPLPLRIGVSGQSVIAADGRVEISAARMALHKAGSVTIDEATA